jgi:GAF domain-containing protein
VGAFETGADQGDSLRRVAESLAELTRELRDEPPEVALTRLLERASGEILGAQWGSVTVVRRGKPKTIAATDDKAIAIDEAQYAHGSGPCVDAVLEDAVYVSDDLASEDRWGDLGPRLEKEFGVRSMLAHRLHLLNESEAIAGLNFSSDRPGAFSDEDVHRGMVLASHCALLVTSALAESRATHLLRALQSNREIGVAVGVLMARYGLTREQAFDLLRIGSQRSNRKLAELAAEVADTGLAPDEL